MTIAACSTDLLAALEAFEPEKATNREKLELAQQAMQLAVDLTDEVAKDTDDGYAEAYLVDHLKIMTSTWNMHSSKCRNSFTQKEKAL